jgi:drug/metabolite transporter (DMT)-like permease
LAGITLFNTFVYIAGHYSPAINLALIGTSSSPVIAIILARIFLKEAVTPLRVLGLLLCIGGCFATGIERKLE